jgi:hypothetical protein
LSCCLMVRTCLYKFCYVNFLFYTSLVLTADKAVVRFCSSMKCHTKHYCLLAAKSVSFSYHINCFQDACLPTWLSCEDYYLATAHMWRHQYITSISAFWLHESTQHHQFPEVRSWHHWQITTNAASDNQSATNAITNILLSHRLNLLQLMYELLLFPNS